MKQTLESMLAPITARYNKEQAEAKIADDVKAKGKELTFHEKERIKMSQDPENNAHRGAIALGKKRATDFLDSAMNMHHKDHKANFEGFKSLYNMDPKTMEEDFVRQAEDELNAHPYEKQDPSYVDALKRKYKPTGDTTPTKMKLYDNFCSALDEKHARVGYRGDKKFVESFASTYCLAPNDNDMGLREFQPKP